MKKTIGFVAAAVLLASTSMSMAMELKFAHAAPATDLQQQLAEFFAEEVSTKTDGEITVLIFPQGQLGDDQQMLNGTRSGIIDIQMTGLAIMNGMQPETAVFDLPYMFANRQHAYKVMDGEVGQKMLDDMSKFGMKGLAFPENGYRNVTNNRKPVRTPEDVVGLKIRTNTSVPLNAMFADLKSNPQPLPIAELYTALETGVVEAQEHPINVTHSFRYDEVQKYLSLTEHSYSSLFMSMNLNKWNTLTAEQQKIVAEAAQNATDYQRKLSIQKEEGFITDLEARGMEVNRDVDKAAFQTAPAITATWAAFNKKFGPEMIKTIQAAK
ncbi:DctP family TRAP transporter solute-binding subunit [Pseudovibrio sp. Tun.PSC04-5.I4]|uniref:DctP family TRAP transporter solute-binding subunit n=1 Tax=Pseudovibrio sp. Tun.PSC04-5.I4 TaxID=1798213 RepID=UPI00087E5E18|nr:DctP family TRAP transporter solute-binding subunit [Pseudovibrio sp. Tun.PSC04-5.I4]SDR48554.1 tripartite ATP-independent transporter solute receptor, DctP family [Pseudovibrio sp. Tun.PSC04-5.I4]